MEIFGLLASIVMNECRMTWGVNSGQCFFAKLSNIFRVSNL